MYLLGIYVHFANRCCYSIKNKIFYLIYFTFNDIYLLNLYLYGIFWVFIIEIKKLK